MSTARPEIRSSIWLALPLGAALALGIAQSAKAFTPRPGAMLAGSSVPPNVVILFDNSTSMRYNLAGGLETRPARRRVSIARDVTREVLRQNRGLRYGLFVYNPSTAASLAPGGRMLVPVGSVSPGAGDAHLASLLRHIDAIDPQWTPVTYTPLGETYYELTRYLRGLAPFYTGSGVSVFDSPIEYRCQRNFALVVTDGLPTHDFDRAAELPPASDPDHNNPRVAGEFNLPNWRGRRDPFHLAELAAFANQIDLRSVPRHGVTIDAAGKSWDDPGFAVQNLQTYVVGFGLRAGVGTEEQLNASNNPLAAAAEAGAGRYFSADSAEELGRALNSVLREIHAGVGSGGSSSASSAVLAPGSTLFYRTRYEPDDWSGSVEALTLGSLGRVGEQHWTTDTTLVAGTTLQVQTLSRATDSILMIGPGAAEKLSADQRERLAGEGRRAGVEGASDEAVADSLLRWVTGEKIEPLRGRIRMMGDVINAPLRQSHYDTVPAMDAGERYQAYRASRERDMIPSLLVGSNDGMLHVLDASNGTHRLAYLPTAAYDYLGSKAHANYGGAAYTPGVDGPIQLADVRLDGDWVTMAVAGMGAGGRSLVGVRLFGEGGGNEALSALWERDSGHSGWENLGYTYTEPAFAHLADGTAVVAVGNGYGSAAGEASLLIAEAASGRVVRELTVARRADLEQGNGLSSPRLVLDKDGVLRTAYAGDLHGQLWKFDLAALQASEWSVAFGGQPLFSAAASQPITVQPQVADHPGGGRLLLFGTGKLLEQADLDSTTLQAFYGVWDRPGGSGNLRVDDLQVQAITAQPLIGDRRSRVVTQTPVSWASQSGWYLPLAFAGEQLGERVTRNILLRNGRVVFNTGYVDASNAGDPCEGLTGDGWLMALEYLNGGMPSYTVLDTNQDGVVDDADLLSAGLDLEVGLPGDITLVSGEGAEHYLIAGSSGTETLAGLALSLFRRILWRQLL